MRREKEEIQTLIQQAEEAEDEMFDSYPIINWESLRFLEGKIFAYKNILTILEKEEEIEDEKESGISRNSILDI